MRQDTTCSGYLMPSLRTICDSIRVPVTFADPDRPDMPLIYANPAFAEMSGWHPWELRGINCRILQGRDTDRSVVAEMALCCRERRSDIFSLVNYRRTGERFVNVVALRPIRISPTKTLLMGCQMEYRPGSLRSDLTRHCEAIGNVVHLVRSGRSFRKDGLASHDVLRIDVLNMRFESAFVLVQNALIRNSARTVLRSVAETRYSAVQTG